MNRWLAAVPALLGVLVAAPLVRADRPTKSECALANESAQDSRRTGKLREARRKLATCTADSCPGLIRQDCAQRLQEVDSALPTIVLEVVDSNGHDLTSVHVTMDGSPLAEQLGGTAIDVDPGEHRFLFEAPGFKDRSETFVLREGQRRRSLRVVLDSTAQPPPVAAPNAAPLPQDAPTSSSGGSGMRGLGIGLGAAGAAGVVLGAIFGLVAKSTYDHALRDECGGDPSRCSPQGVRDGETAQGQAAFATIDFVASGALLAAGIAFYFAAPRENPVTVAGTVTNGGAGLAVRARW